MGRFTTILLLLTLSISAKELTWRDVQQLDEFKTAQVALSDHLPELAVTALKGLGNSRELSREASTNLNLLLGESHIRSNQPELALEVLEGTSTQALRWRALALVQMGRLKEAEEHLSNLKEKADVRHRATLLSALRQYEQALVVLSPLLKEDSLAQLIAAGIHLDQGDLKEAELLITSIKPKDDLQEANLELLEGRLALGRGDRVSAVRTFRALVPEKPTDKLPPAHVYHQAVVGLADSLALGGGEAAAAAFLVSHLQNHPQSSNLSALFSRLRQWRDHVPNDQLLKWSASPPPPMTLLSGSLPPPPASGLHVFSLQLSALKAVDGDIPSHAAFLFSRFLLETPAEYEDQISQSLIDLGLFHFELNQVTQALSVFQLVRDRAPEGRLQAIATSLQGAAAFALQDPKQAAAAFEEAKASALLFREVDLAHAASMNQALSYLEMGRDADLTSLEEPAKADLFLEQGLLMASRDEAGAREFLENFRSRFPDHERIDEATLALAENYIFASNSDTKEGSKAKALKLLAELNFDDVEEPLESARKLIALMELNQGIEAASLWLNRNPNHSATPNLLFYLARAQHQNGKSGPAFASYEQLIQNFPDHSLIRTVGLYSARAAFSVGTESAEARGFERYRELMTGDDPLAVQAAIEFARLQIDRGEELVAISELEKFLGKKTLDPKDKRRFLVLIAEAERQSGQFQKALSHYEQLLNQSDLPVSFFNQASYLKGRVLEDLRQPNAALESYYSVINRNLDPDKAAEVEWRWHDRCALEGALPILEKNNKWEAALALTRKIALSGGPSAQRAAERAKRIQFDHMIWDEAE
ncbi:MAG: tetratricopeptide repeat protein [Verrucomicrobiaceae bacterium]